MGVSNLSKVTLAHALLSFQWHLISCQTQICKNSLIYIPNSSLPSSLMALPSCHAHFFGVFQTWQTGSTLREHASPSAWKALAQLSSWLPPSPPPSLYQRALVTEAFLGHLVIYDDLLSHSILPYPLTPITSEYSYITDTPVYHFFPPTGM